MHKFYCVFFTFTFILAHIAQAQITIVEHASSLGEISIGASYGQDFNTLPKAELGTAITWEDNRTLPGWYVQLTCPDAGATKVHSLYTCATGPANLEGILFSLAQHFDTTSNNSPTSAWRSLGAMPSAVNSPVTLGLRFQNQTKKTISGLRVTWENKWAYTGSLDAKGKPLPVNSTHSVKLRWRKFASGQGNLAQSPQGWTDVISSNIDNHDTSIPDCWKSYNQRITRLHIAEGEEVWLAWEITRISGEPAVVAIDNVRVTDIAGASPFITRQPLPQTVPYGGGVDFDIEASGQSDLSYQWFRDGVIIPEATAATLHLTSPGRSEDGARFSCRVSTAEGEILSEPAILKVYAPLQVCGPALPVTLKVDTSGYFADPALADVKYLPEGRREAADLYLPNPLQAKCPAIVIVHGGGGNDGDKRRAREAQAGLELARRGYVAMSINYKMSSKSSASWPRNVQDAFHAVRWLRAHAATYSIDADNIGALGFSWGCNTVAMLSVIRYMDTFEGERIDGVVLGDASTLPGYSSSVQAVAAYYGAVDPGNYHQMKMHGYATTADDAPTRYFAASPVNFAHSAAAPCYLSHGMADTDVLMSQLFTLRDRLRDVGAVVYQHLVRYGEHSYGVYDTAHIAKSAPDGYVIDERPRLFGFFDRYLGNAAPTLSSPVQPDRQSSLPVHPPTVPQTQTGLPAIEAAISSSAPNDNIDEANQGYLSVKYSAALTASRKAYFQFAVTPPPASALVSAPARFTILLASTFRQRVQLWALDQAYPTFSNGLIWKDAPANDQASNGLLRTGPFTASPLGESQLAPSAPDASLEFTLTDWARFVHGGKITLVLTGVEDTANNKGGLRLAASSARLILPGTKP